MTDMQQCVLESARCCGCRHAMSCHDMRIGSNNAASVAQLLAASDGDVARLCAQLRASVFGGRQGPEALSSACTLLRALGQDGERALEGGSAEERALPAAEAGVLRGRVLRWDDGSKRARYAPGNAVAAHPDYLAVLVAAACLVGAQPAQLHEHVLVLEWGLTRVDAVLRADDEAPAR